MWVCDKKSLDNSQENHEKHCFSSEAVILKEGVRRKMFVTSGAHLSSCCRDDPV